MQTRERYVRAAGAGSAIGGAILLAILTWTETALGPAQDLSRGGAGDPARIAFSISLAVWAFAGFAIALLALGFGLRRSTDPRWPLVALGIAAALLALAGAMLTHRDRHWWSARDPRRGDLRRRVDSDRQADLVRTWVPRSGLYRRQFVRL